MFHSFYFEDYSFDFTSNVATFRYSFDEDIFFEESVDFSSPHFEKQIFQIDANFDNLLASMHLALGISYYKLFPTQSLVSKQILLDEGDIEFWKKFYKHGLGEFLYTNKLDQKKYFSFINAPGAKDFIKIHITQEAKAKSYSKNLLPIGGGKDSLVSLALLNHAGVDFTPIVVGKIDPIKHDVLSYIDKEVLNITRKIDPRLFDWNKKEGTYNGHVPISGMLAFIMELAAYIYGFDSIIMSNELSADSPNTDWMGLEINHQYSKSGEFERDFSKYRDKHFPKTADYFSLLRGMYELKITQLFAEYSGKYFDSFSSCNRNFVINANAHHNGRWCTQCSKCMFVFIMLSAYLDQQTLTGIFGENLYDKEINKNLLYELVGLQDIKPLECVGQREEVLIALHQYYKKYGAVNILIQDLLAEHPNIFENLPEKNKYMQIHEVESIPQFFKNIVTNN